MGLTVYCVILYSVKEKDKVNIGLNLKFDRRRKEVCL